MVTVYLARVLGNRTLDTAGINGQILTSILFSTCVTPGARQAADSASSRSAHERTVPLRITLPPIASTEIRFASTTALRLNASSILVLISTGDTMGATSIEFVTPFTPARYLTSLSAADF